MGTIPEELKALNQWVTWRGINRGGPKPSKVPHNPATGRWAKTNDPRTWGSYEAATAAAEAQGMSGVGFVFTADDPYVGIDLDGCRDPEAGTIEGWAQRIIDRFDTYADVSPSGTGIHLICRGALERGRRLGRVEVYNRGRYFCMTGRRINDRGIAEIDNILSKAAA